MLGKTLGDAKKILGGMVVVGERHLTSKLPQPVGPCLDDRDLNNDSMCRLPGGGRGRLIWKPSHWQENLRIPPSAS